MPMHKKSAIIIAVAAVLCLILGFMYAAEQQENMRLQLQLSDSQYLHQQELQSMGDKLAACNARNNDLSSQLSSCEGSEQETVNP